MSSQAMSKQFLNLNKLKRKLKHTGLFRENLLNDIQSSSGQDDLTARAQNLLIQQKEFFIERICS